MLARARKTAAALPAPGTLEYRVQRTDTLITRMVMKEAEDVLPFMSVMVATTTRRTRRSTMSRPWNPRGFRA